MNAPDGTTPNELPISGEHIAAINRQRRIIFQDDVLANDVFRTNEIGTERLNRIIDFYMSRLDEQPNQIDSIWFEWGEGNTAVWPSEVMPCTENVFPRWWKAGIDPVEILLTEAKKRDREVFFSYRINGSDNDDLFDPPRPFDQPIPLKAEHPEWLIYKWHPYWNFAFQGVRDLKLNVVREVAEMYDFDGIQIDFARIPVLFPEEQWLHRNTLTDFMRDIRTALLDIEKKRGRPLLLAARVPEDSMGCHFDGMDVETWVRDFLVDILVVGTRTANADIAAFRHITKGTPIKLYPSFDDHHSTDGYREPDLEIWRGTCANWWRQNPDGMHTFNLMLSSPQSAQNLGLNPSPRWETQRKVFSEIGSPETLKGKDKVFFVERRGGGHAEYVVPSPANWRTPRHMYFQTNMLAALPAGLAEDGGEDTLLLLNVADDVNAASANIDQLTLQIAISDEAGETLSVDEKLEELGSGVEVRLNNLLLDTPRTETVENPKVDAFKNWLIFTVAPRYLAVGANLVGVRLSQQPPSLFGRIQIEKLELHVRYKSPNEGIMTTTNLLARREKLLGTGTPLFYQEAVNIVRGEGAWLFDTDGRRYLDMYNNVPCVGHCHPHVVEAMHRQASTLNVHSRYLHEGVLDYAERLTSRHAEELASVVFTCTGTEANEVAMSMARIATGGRGIICTDAAYHGNSAEVGKLTRARNGDPEIRAIPYPQRYRPLREGTSESELTDLYLSEVRAAIDNFAANNIPFAGMLVCPILANEGLPDIPNGFMPQAAKIVRDAGGLFITDEVQAGFCRTGRWWGYEVMDFVPDIVTMGKPMGNGLPLAGTVARTELVDAFRDRKRYFNTFASSPLQAAVGMAVIEVIETENLRENVADVGDYLRTELTKLQPHCPPMAEVRGHGLFIGLEWVSDRDAKTPDRDGATVFVNRLKDKGFLIGSAGSLGNVLKIRPPLVFSREHADLFLTAFAEIVEEIYGTAP